MDITFLRYPFASCRVIERTISSAYAAVCSKNLQTVGSSLASSATVMESTVETSARTSVDIPRELFQMLSVAGPYLHRDTVLLQKV